MKDNYTYHSADGGWIGKPNNGGDLGGLMDITAELNRLKALTPEGWLPIDTAPKDGTWIIIAGPSGYTSTPLRAAIARYYPEYRPTDPWQTHSNDSFSDGGPAPTLWMHLPEDSALRTMSDLTPKTDACTGDCRCNSVGPGVAEDACPRSEMLKLEIAPQKSRKRIRQAYRLADALALALINSRADADQRVEEAETRDMKHREIARLQLARQCEELEELRRWKAEAMESFPDWQEIGKELNLQIGDDVKDHILPGIRALKHALRDMLGKSHGAAVRARQLLQGKIA